jgi:hypothetical protein
MADAVPSRPDSWDPDETRRPPTFVQIRPPAAPGGARRKAGIVVAGLALAVALGWAVHRMTDEREGPAATQAAPTAPTVTHIAAPQPVPLPPDLYDELARSAIDTAVSTPPWSRESLMDRVSPFDPSVRDRMPSGVQPVDTADAAHAGSVEIAVRLGKGDTIGSALRKLGIASDAITDVISALAPHVRLKRLPTGLAMTVQIRPSEEQGVKPILQALTLHPEGRREIKVQRDSEGDYAVALDRPSAR